MENMRRNEREDLEFQQQRIHHFNQQTNQNMQEQQQRINDNYHNQF